MKAIPNECEPRTIAVIDGFDDGHHLTYLRLHARVLLEMGCRVLALLPDPAAVEGWLNRQYPPGTSGIRFHPFRHEKPVSPFWRLRRLHGPCSMWWRARVALREAERHTGFRADLAFFCWLDDYVVGASPAFRVILPVVFPRRWSGLFFHPWHLRIPDGPTRADSVAAESVLKAGNCRSVAVLDEGIAEPFRAALGKSVVVFPDATDTRLPAQETDLVGELRRRAAGRKIIGLLGHLSKRKGIASLLRAAQAAAGRPWFFVFAGALAEAGRSEFNPEDNARIDRAVAGRVDNVFFHTERIDDECAFNAVVNACDVLFASYELFAHSSGLVTKAAAFRKPIIVSRGYCMEERVREFKMGLAVDARRSGEVIAAIEALTDPAAFRARVGEPQFERCAAVHSVEALKPAYETILAEI